MGFRQQQTAKLFLIISESVAKGFISPRHTNANQMLTFLNKLNPSKATGLDKISARMPCIPISNIFNCSLTTGFLNNWKWAKVTPLIKQGRSNDVNN